MAVTSSKIGLANDQLSINMQAIKVINIIVRVKDIFFADIQHPRIHILLLYCIMYKCVRAFIQIPSLMQILYNGRYHTLFVDAIFSI